MVDKCYKLELKEGQSVFIPTGWIHAVYTPVHSVVFGGNFLHSLNIQLQLRIYELESRLKDPPKYRFPSFEVVHWLAANKLKKDLADLNSDNTPCPANLLNGIRSLVATLRNWLNDPDKELIDQIDTNNILKDLSREVKTAERIALKMNPPKPERESNRRRKKKILDDDFIDISDPSSASMYDWSARKQSGTKKQVKKKPEVDHKSVEDDELEKILMNHSQSFSYHSPHKRTVSPLRLSLSTNKTSQPRPDDDDDEEGFDLTDRDSVRQLMVNKNKASNLTDALEDAMNDFGADNNSLIIDESPKAKKKPLKLRLSVGSVSDLNLENSFSSINTSPVKSVSSMKKLPPKLAVKASLKKKAVQMARRAQDMKMNKVHQDDDYIYPALGKNSSYLEVVHEILIPLNVYKFYHI